MVFVLRIGHAERALQVARQRGEAGLPLGFARQIDVARLLDRDEGRLLQRLVGAGHGGRKVDLDRHGGQRRGHHEDDEEHKHHVHEGRHVDVGILLEVEPAAAAGAGELRRHT